MASTHGFSLGSTRKAAYLICLAAIFGARSSGEVCELERSFYNPAPHYRDHFGYAVADSDGDILIGATLKDVSVEDEGIAYLFESGTGDLIRTFNNPTPGVGDLFGFPLVSVGGTTWISSVGDDSVGVNYGAVYVFETSSGNLLDTLYSPNPSSSGTFGARLVRTGDDVIVSSYRENVTEDRDGKVYLFDGETRELMRTFSSPSPALDEDFGQSIAIAGGDIVIAARRPGLGVEDSLVAYLYETETGNLLRTFLDPFPYTMDCPVVTTAVAGNCVVVGSMLDDTLGPSTGAVFVFDLASGNFIRKIYSPSPHENAKFGAASSDLETYWL